MLINQVAVEDHLGGLYWLRCLTLQAAESTEPASAAWRHIIILISWTGCHLDLDLDLPRLTDEVDLAWLGASPKTFFTAASI